MYIAYGVYISQLIRYSRTCSSYHDFPGRGLLLNQWFLVVKLKSALRTFCGHHHVLVNHYGIFVSHDHGYVPFVVITIKELTAINGISYEVSEKLPFSCLNSHQDKQHNNNSLYSKAIQLI
jgi:hypothetical protein